MSNMILHKAGTRGHADHGWLQAKHTFSFANYYDPERVHFGVLRVLNDDTVAPGMGFGMHPHDNMEIITIPLSGALEHRDNMGNTAVVRYGDIQVMSAGTGVTHSEYNASREHPVRLLQIWVFPDKHNISPRYDQISLDVSDRVNRFQQVVSPHADDAGLWIHQQAWFHLAKFDKGYSDTYRLKAPGNGLYIFIISGTVTVAGQVLSDRDGLGIRDVAEVTIAADSDAEFLLMEVPMDMQ